MVRRYFLQHPRSLGESYLEHQVAAVAIALRLLRASLACLVHAVVPHFCQTTASRTIRQLHSGLSVRSTPARDRPEEAIEYQI